MGSAGCNLLKHRTIFAKTVNTNRRTAGYPKSESVSLAGQSRAAVRLLDSTGNRRKRVISVGTDQANGADYDHENHSQHDRIFGYILAVLIAPQRSNEVLHGDSPRACEG